MPRGTARSRAHRTVPDLRFAIPARHELVARYRALPPPERVDDLGAERARARDIADAYLESVVDGLVLVFLDQGTAVAPATAGLLRQLAGLVASGARAVLHAGLARAGREELLALRGFLRERLHPTPEGPWPGLLLFPLDAGAAAHALAVRRALADRSVPAGREALAAAMLAVVDGAIRHHFEEPVALMRPGFVVRQALAVATAGIRRSAHAVLRRAIRHEGEAQLTALARFLDSAISHGPGAPP